MNDRITKGYDTKDSKTTSAADLPQPVQAERDLEDNHPNSAVGATGGMMPFDDLRDAVASTLEDLARRRYGDMVRKPFITGNKAQAPNINKVDLENYLVAWRQNEEDLYTLIQQGAGGAAHVSAVEYDRLIAKLLEYMPEWVLSPLLSDAFYVAARSGKSRDSNKIALTAILRYEGQDIHLFRHLLIEEWPPLESAREGRIDEPDNAGLRPVSNQVAESDFERLMAEFAEEDRRSRAIWQIVEEEERDGAMG